MASFLGVSNLLEGTAVGDDRVKLADGTEVQCRREALGGRAGTVQIGVRPEKLRIGGGEANSLSGTVSESAYIGVSTQYILDTSAGPVAVYVQNDRSGGQVATGERLTLELESRKHLRRRPGGLVMTDRITRRTFVRRAAASGSILTVPGLLAACGGGGGGGSTSSGGTTQQLAKTLHFSNWTLYMDTDKKNHTFPSLVEFQKKYGVNVDYVEDINDNAGFYNSKLRPPLSRGQSTGRDIVVLTDNDRYLGLMLKQGWAEKLDKSAIPNMKNLIDVQKHPSFDPNRDYTLPWQSGMTGIAYNDTLTGPVLSIDELLGNPKLKGKITVLNDIGDAMTLVMLANGDDPGKVTDKTWNAAFNRIKKASATTAKSARSRATTMQRRLRTATLPPRCRGRAISHRSATSTSTGTCRRTAEPSGPTTC